METAITIGLGERKIVLEAVRDRMPSVVEMAKHLVALFRRTHGHPESEEIVHSRDSCHPFRPHFHKNAVGLLLSNLHTRNHPLLLQEYPECGGRHRKECTVLTMECSELLRNPFSVRRIHYRKCQGLDPILQA